MHADQLTVSLSVVRELVDEQFPSWRQLAITAVESAGTVNAIFRLGDSPAHYTSAHRAHVVIHGQPTTLFEHMSISVARYAKPEYVQI